MRTIKDNIKEAIGRSLDAYNKKFGKAIHDRIDNIVAQAGTDNTEIVDARVDSSGKTHTTLNNRINEEFKKGKEHMQSVSGSHLNLDGAMESYLQNIKIEGNTIQNPSNLADIKSVGDKIRDEELYRIPIVCCGANINSTNLIRGNCNTNTGVSESGGMTILITSDFLKVPENTTFSYDTNGIKIRNIITFSYDADKKYIGYENTIKSKPSAKFMKVRFTKDDRTEFTDKEVNDIRLSINVGEQSIPYEDYKEHKLTILSPVQLEKVGDIADRIIEKDGVWGVEKNINTKSPIDNTIAFVDSLSNETTQYAETKFNSCGFDDMVIKPNGALICDKLKCKTANEVYGKENTDKGISMTETRFNIRLFRSEVSDNVNLREYLKTLKIKYQTNKPQFIPLPHSQQVKLKTFANKANISFLTEIEGTIKADVAKSISASVNSNTQEIGKINNRILDLEGLKESQEMSYETDKGYLVCKETKAGTVKDMKVYGKSLVNRVNPNRNTSIRTDDILTDNLTTKDFLSGTYYAYKLTDKLCRLGIYSKDTNSYLRGYTLRDSVTEVVISNNEYIKVSSCSFSEGWTVNDVEKFKNAIVILDTNNESINSYFEGIASVGTEVDKIEVSSVKTDGNLFDISSVPNSIQVNGTEMYSSCINFRDIKPITINGKCTVKFKSKSDDGGRVNFVFVYEDGTKDPNYYDITSEYKDYRFTSNQNKKCKYVEVSFNSSIKHCYVKDLIISNLDIPYQPYVCDKKTILYKDSDGTWKPVSELRGLDTVCDTVELHSDGKYYYHQRTEKEVIDGSDKHSIIDGGINDTVSRFVITSSSINHNKVKLSLLCDKFNALDDENAEGIFLYPLNHNRIDIRIGNSKIPTQNTEGFKQYLQSNPVTVVYPLAEEKVFEVNPLFLEAFEGETMASVNSGVVNAPIEFKITSYITNLVLLNQQRISILEQEMFSMFKAVLSGDMRALAENIYPEDFIYENEPPIMLLSK